MTTVDVSVVVPTYGGAHRLPPLLEALAGQTTARRWEVVVVVDGVVDDTPGVLDAWRARLPLETVVFPRNEGRVRALNRGFASAGGRVLIRCDDDLTPGPGFVEHHAAHHDDTDRCGVIGLTRDVLPASRYAAAYGEVEDRRRRRIAYAAPAHQRWRHWAANCSLTREAWDALDGYDERLRFGEDVELGWRLARSGVDLVIDPALETDHRGAAGDARTRVPRAFTSGAAQALIARWHPEMSAPEMVAGGSTGTPGMRARLWTTWVALLARAANEPARAARLGGAVDRVLSIVPPMAGRALVASAVEAAGRAGALADPEVLEAFAEVRARQLDAERVR